MPIRYISKVPILPLMVHVHASRVAKFSFSKITGSFFSLQRTIAKKKISNNFLIFFSRPLKRPKQFLSRPKENILFSFSSFLTLKN